MRSQCDKCGYQGELWEDIKLYGTSSATTLDRTVRICKYCIWRTDMPAMSEGDSRRQMQEKASGDDGQ